MWNLNYDTNELIYETVLIDVESRPAVAKMEGEWIGSLG